MNDEPPILSFAEHRESAERDTEVRCPKCGKWILMHSTCCDHCGIHFSGEAWEFSPSTKIPSSSMSIRSRWIVVVVVVISLIAVLLANLL